MPHKPLRKIYLDLLIIAAGFTLLAYLWDVVYLYIPAGVAGLCALHPKTASALSLGWEKLGKALGWVNTRILLTVFFALVITPIALLSRAFAKKSKAKTMWKDVSDHPTDFDKPW